jgi:hypothetical protein
MIGGTETIQFIERSLRSEPHEVECVPLVAAILCAGFRFKKGVPNHADITLGCDRLPLFMESRDMDLERRVVWNFALASRSELLGAADTFTAYGFLTRFRQDAVLRRSILALSAFEKWRVGLIESLRKSGKRAFVAEDSGVQCYGQIFGDRETFSAFHDMFDTATW